MVGLSWKISSKIWMMTGGTPYDLGNSQTIVSFLNMFFWGKQTRSIWITRLGNSEKKVAPHSNWLTVMDITCIASLLAISSNQIGTTSRETERVGHVCSWHDRQSQPWGSSKTSSQSEQGEPTTIPKSWPFLWLVDIIISSPSALFMTLDLPRGPPHHPF